MRLKREFPALLLPLGVHQRRDSAARLTVGGDSQKQWRLIQPLKRRIRRQRGQPALLDSGGVKAPGQQHRAGTQIHQLHQSSPGVGPVIGPPLDVNLLQPLDFCKKLLLHHAPGNQLHRAAVRFGQRIIAPGLSEMKLFPRQEVEENYRRKVSDDQT